jgi:ATP-binding cassette subfamily B protein
MLHSLTARKEWKFFAVLPKAAPVLAVAWWAVLLLRGALPAAFANAMGVAPRLCPARPIPPRTPRL